MAILNPAFVTGASAVVKVGNKQIAFVTDLNINVNMGTIPIESMGKFEVHANEPFNYSVEGSFRIIRYTATTDVNIKDAKSVGTNTPTAFDIGPSQNIGDSLNPARLLNSTAFNLDVYDKRGTDAQWVYSVTDCRLVSRSGGVSRQGGVYTEVINFIGLRLLDKDQAAQISVTAGA